MSDSSTKEGLKKGNLFQIVFALTALGLEPKMPAKYDITDLILVPVYFDLLCLKKKKQVGLLSHWS